MGGRQDLLSPLRCLRGFALQRGAVAPPLHANAVYVGRWHCSRNGAETPASVWANPFRLADCPSREVCLERYRAYLRALRDFPGSLLVLSGTRLVCHCRDHEQCHADVLIDEFRRHFPSEVAGVQLASAFVGVPWTPVQFVERAWSVQHPYDDCRVDIAFAIALFSTLTTGVEATKRRRRACLARWALRAVELRADEEALHARMSPSAAHVVKGKVFLLLGEMLSELGVAGADTLVL